MLFVTRWGNVSQNTKEESELDLGLDWGHWLQMRKSNDQKYEHAVQLGVGGIDKASEGPINRNTGASYLFNYRYSMTGLANQIGMIDMRGHVQADDVQPLPAQYQL